MRGFRFVLCASSLAALSWPAPWPCLRAAWGQVPPEATRVDTPTSVPRDEERALPQSAEAALAQAAAAYEYGDMPLLVESARLLTDGSLHATPPQRAQALRFLGIGLYVTGRVEGARDAFGQLLSLEPDSQLDPATTRPEIVAYFHELRRARLEELRATYLAQRPSLLWNFLPPVGQFHNGERAKGWILLGAEAATFLTATVTFAIGRAWLQEDGTVCENPGPCDRTDTAKLLRSVNIASVLGFAALYAYGLIDGISGHRRLPSDETLLRLAPPPVSVSLLPNGAALSVRF